MFGPTPPEHISYLYISLYLYVSVVFGRAELNYIICYFCLSVSIHVPSHFRLQLACAVSLAV